MTNRQESREVQRFKATKIKAEQGNARAQFELGLLYYSLGVGVPKDYVEAAKWYRKEAEAQLLLGGMYLEGVPKNDIETYAWYLLAKANGVEEASKEISDLEERLTVKQGKKGQARGLELHRLIEQKSAK